MQVSSERRNRSCHNRYMCTAVVAPCVGGAGWGGTSGESGPGGLRGKSLKKMDSGGKQLAQLCTVVLNQCTSYSTSTTTAIYVVAGLGPLGNTRCCKKVECYLITCWLGETTPVSCQKTQMDSVSCNIPVGHTLKTQQENCMKTIPCLADPPPTITRPRTLSLSFRPHQSNSAGTVRGGAWAWR